MPLLWMKRLPKRESRVPFSSQNVLKTSDELDVIETQQQLLRVMKGSVHEFGLTVAIP